MTKNIRDTIKHAFQSDNIQRLCQHDALNKVSKGTGTRTKVVCAQLPECTIGIAILTWTKTFLKDQISSMNKEDGLMDRFLLVCPKPENLVSNDVSIMFTEEREDHKSLCVFCYILW